MLVTQLLFHVSVFKEDFITLCFPQFSETHSACAPGQAAFHEAPPVPEAAPARLPVALSFRLPRRTTLHASAAPLYSRAPPRGCLLTAAW